MSKERVERLSEAAKRLYHQGGAERYTRGQELESDGRYNHAITAYTDAKRNYVEAGEKGNVAKADNAIRRVRKAMASEHRHSHDGLLAKAAAFFGFASLGVALISGVPVMNGAFMGVNGNSLGWISGATFFLSAILLYIYLISKKN